MNRNIVFASVVIALTSTPVLASAQAAVGARVGVADGSTSWVVGEINGRIPVASRAVATAALHLISSPSACDASWPDSFKCGYSGFGLAAGPGLNVLNAGRVQLDVGGAIGLFTRTGDGLGDETALTWSVGSDAAFALGGRVSLQASVHHRRIRDKIYRGLFNEDVKVTALTSGVLVQF